MSISRYWGSKPEDIIRLFIKDLEGDTIVDPFGGSGTIARISLEMGKKAVYIDINPYAWLVAHVSIAGAPASEYEEAAKHVVEIAESDRKSRRYRPRHDYLRYANGRHFWKRRRFDRVSDLFTRDNACKLFRLLKSIDLVECTTRTKLALYLTFCTTLFRSSLMNREGAGTWGVPCYWVPKNSSPRDPFAAFITASKRLTRYLRRAKFYSVAYDINDLKDNDIVMLIGNALTFRYRSGWSLFTDPPFLDEIQYMELSYFYWAWLRESKLPTLMAKLMGKRRIYLRFSAEMVVNPARGVTTKEYMNMLEAFMGRTKCMREKAMLFHAEEDDIVKRVISIASRQWRNVVLKRTSLENQRRVGPRGSKEYILILSRL